jgi:hypothetical protein
MHAGLTHSTLTTHSNSSGPLGPRASQHRRVHGHSVSVPASPLLCLHLQLRPSEYHSTSAPPIRMHILELTPGGNLASATQSPTAVSLSPCMGGGVCWDWDWRWGPGIERMWRAGEECVEEARGGRVHWMRRPSASRGGELRVVVCVWCGRWSEVG